MVDPHPSKLMIDFLSSMAECQEGKGAPVSRQNKRLAGKAVSDGYGMMLGISGLMLFIINSDGRAVAMPVIKDSLRTAEPGEGDHHGN